MVVGDVELQFVKSSFQKMFLDSKCGKSTIDIVNSERLTAGIVGVLRIREAAVIDLEIFAEKMIQLCFS